MPYKKGEGITDEPVDCTHVTKKRVRNVVGGVDTANIFPSKKHSGSRFVACS